MMEQSTYNGTDFYAKRSSYYSTRVSRVLWRDLESSLDEIDMYCVLRTLLERSQWESISQFFPDHAVRGLVAALKEDHSPHVYILVFSLLGFSCNIRSTMKVDLGRDGQLIRYIMQCVLGATDISRETVLNAQGNPEENEIITEMYVKASGLLAFFSTSSQICRDSLLFENAVKVMTDVLDHRNPVTYQFSRSAKEESKELVLNKSLMGVVKGWDSADATNELDLIWTGIKNQTVCIDELFDTSTCEDTDINVKVELLKTGQVWRSECETKEQYDENQWKDVHVTETVDCQRVWAHIGTEEDLGIADRIQDTLEKYPDDRKNYLKHVPKNGSFVCAKNRGSYFRGQVVDSNPLQSDKVTLFALDYGFTCCVIYEETFCLSSDMGIKYPPQAKFCKIAGMQAPPFNMELVRNALSILINLTSNMDQIKGTKFMECDVYGKLGPLCLARDLQVRELVLKLFAHLFRDETARKKAGQCGVAQFVVEAMKDLVVKYSTQSIELKVLTTTMDAINNFMFDCPQNKRIVEELGGIKSLLRLSASNSPEVVRAVSKAIRIFTSSVTIPTPQDHRRSPEPLMKLPLFQSDGAKKESTRLAPMNTGASKPLSDPQREARHRSSSRHRTQSESHRRHRSVSVGRRSKYSDNVPKSGMDSDDENIDSSYSSDPDNQKYFVKERHTGIHKDHANELLEANRADAIDKDSFIKFAVGFLNKGKGGSLYWGMRKSGVAEGIVVNRKQRDDLKVNVDSWIRCIKPWVMPQMYEVKFHSVKDEDRPRNDLRIIEAVIKPISDCHTYHYNGQSFIRVEDETRPFHFYEVHNQQILKEEKGFLSQIENLKHLIGLKGGKELIS